jgi:hypothetical protein
MSFLIGFTSSVSEEPYNFDQDPMDASPEETGELILWIKNPDGSFTVYRITRTDGPCGSGYCFAVDMDWRKYTTSEVPTPDVLFPHPSEGQTEENEGEDDPMVYWFVGEEVEDTQYDDILTLKFSNRSHDFVGEIKVDKYGGDPYYPRGRVEDEMGDDFSIGAFDGNW